MPGLKFNAISMLRLKLILSIWAINAGDTPTKVAIRHNYCETVLF